MKLVYNYLLNILFHVGGYLLESISVEFVEYVLCNVIINLPNIFACRIVMHFQVLFVLFSVELNVVKGIRVAEVNSPLPRGFNDFFIFLKFNARKALAWCDISRLPIILLKFQREWIDWFV